MQDHLSNVLEAIQVYQKQNRQPAIPEPANDFEKAINEHNELQGLIAAVKEALKPAEAAERKARDGIAASLDAYLADSRKEGVNNYELSNGRKLKYTYAVTRSIDESHIGAARDAYAAAGDAPDGATFDDLLRTKYELQKKAFNNLDGEALLAASRMIVAKSAASKVEVD